MGPGAASLDSLPGKSEEVQVSVSSVLEGADPRTNEPAKPPFVTPTSLRRAHTVAQGRYLGGKTNVASSSAKEMISLSSLRSKDSHELLRKRPTKQPGDPQQSPREAFIPARESSHFTVGNVGQNGKIFLRPIRNLSLKEPRRPPTSPPINQPKPEFLPPQAQDGYGQEEPSRWSNSQLSELRPELMEGSREDGASIISGSARSEAHYHTRQHPLQRSHSFSTISDQRSASRAGGRSEFRIVIDRPGDRPRSADASFIQSLEVSVPNYQLGVSQFSTSDNVLPSSIYSTEAWNSSIAPNAYLDNPARPSFVPSMFSGVSAMDLTRTTAVSPDPVVYDQKESIKPSIFEAMASVMDDESVVRYVPGTKNIGAATPARIVAQISSESFMDYELVSDFFLTFRLYLSTGSLLSLLLARLQWAINRLQEDGRIIRIRTFAALRHWILNYFADDFVPDLKLRAHFCESINQLYGDVKARQGGGMSDLKIIIDLKRCWHGKCSAYWDIPNKNLSYHNPDYPIDPGGNEPAFGEDFQNIIRTDSNQSSAQGEVRNPPPAVRHDRNNSSTTTKSMPVSIDSDWSAPAISCSLPSKSPKRLSIPFTTVKAPHPVPVIPPRQIGPLPDPSSPLSPISSRRHPFYGHAHKRSGSFSDSVRDGRAPLPLLRLDNKSSFSSQEPCYLGSLIRGELYAPVESYMTILAPPSPPLPSSANTALDRRSTAGAPPKSATSGSGVKTIIGSIRRVFNSKHVGHGFHPHPVNGPSTRGKTSALPTNVAFKSDLYRERKVAPPPNRPSKIDLLCDEVLRQYHEAFNGNVNSQTDNADGQQRLLSGSDPVPDNFLVPDNGRAPSQLTTGSESIVIVDGTGLGSPTSLEQPPRFLTGASFPPTPKAYTFLASSRGSTLAPDEYSLPIYYEESIRRPSRRVSTFFRPSGASTSQRSSSLERASISWKRPSVSLGLRKYASFQSVISKRRAAQASETTGSVTDSFDNDYSDKRGGPTLRRRPGGDLRQMRDVGGGGGHSYPDSGSILSDATYDSMGYSQEEPASRPQTILMPPNPRFSLLKTHPSQNLRRSFEAAIARFAEIPDDGDGGIESTLLKLEGKWKAQSAQDGGSASADTRQLSESTQTQPDIHREERTSYDQYLGSSVGPVKGHPKIGDNLSYSQVRARSLTPGADSESIVESEDSYSSIPLLERGLSDESMKKPAADLVSLRGAAQSRSGLTREMSDNGSSHPSIDMVKKTESLKRIPTGSTLPVYNPVDFKARRSRLSGLSSEISSDLIETREAVDQRLSFDTRSLAESSLNIPPHPLAHPPSPPMTIQQPRSVHSYRNSLNPIFAKAQPLTPDPSPINTAPRRTHIPSGDMHHVSGDVLSRSEADHHPQGPIQVQGPHHVPFVLSCESHILAQQFTLVEMAALGEVDWRDLVDRKWNSGPHLTTSWVQFLLEDGRRGIDLVVGRFNIMVKWALSEIVLTNDIHERALTITKLIHTAAHARRMCNYATMLQIAIALSSTDCSRLRATWALVAPEDRRVLKDIELLIQPVRNFHELRLEMETANLQEGCIPFVGKSFPPPFRIHVDRHFN
ncbi:hypothetical protein P175DRAFT_0179900 [Aspergillus ochraceoroseus IBT 24754]|uniref:Ras-GEF domain-containing protein n=1 Tax=Aspergillus ochraceoroseus IBT 24754 TaxID=1392256 RepID=A0A2T5LYF2_9EURO|nr:uncharacterized protein P175DRAFT_0179900 [Aspergillus ochraceoroseus IBT 24754]PTU21311.1 hypothetical protein P175DRAFT_0179900 [Aspergillus ochraceoroseus IBT 24754]